MRVAGRHPLSIVSGEWLIREVNGAIESRMHSYQFVSRSGVAVILWIDKSAP